MEYFLCYHQAVPQNTKQQNKVKPSETGVGGRERNGRSREEKERGGGERAEEKGREREPLNDLKKKFETLSLTSRK